MGSAGLSCPARPRGEHTKPHTSGAEASAPREAARGPARAPTLVSEERPIVLGGPKYPQRSLSPAYRRRVEPREVWRSIRRRRVRVTSALGRIGSQVAGACCHHAKRPSGTRAVRLANPKTVVALGISRWAASSRSLRVFPISTLRTPGYQPYGDPCTHSVQVISRRIRFAVSTTACCNNGDFRRKRLRPVGRFRATGPGGWRG